jgi:hypothetical protein
MITGPSDLLTGALTVPCAIPSVQRHIGHEPAAWAANPASVDHRSATGAGVAGGAILGRRVALDGIGRAAQRRLIVGRIRLSRGAHRSRT